MKPTKRLRATRPLTYLTRRLLPGDEFTASPRDARVLRATRRAEEVRDPVDLAPPSPEQAAAIATALSGLNDGEPLKELRIQYESVVGRRPYHGWTADQIKEKIAAAKGA